MDYRKFLVLLSVLLVIPIVKADGCGIVCPKNPNDLLTFSLASLCNFFTWGFCHIFAFIVVAVIGMIVFAFWHYLDDEKKKKDIKLFLYAGLTIFILFALSSYIKAWVYTPVSVDTCASSDVNVTQCNVNAGSHIPIITTNYWRYSCNKCSGGVTSPCDIVFSLTGTGTVTGTTSLTDDDIHTIPVINLNGTSYSLECSASPT
jgi:hypothetical protein